MTAKMDISLVREVDLNDIELKDSNVRSDLQSPNSKASIAELAENIKLNGLLQPIVLRGTFGESPYDVVVGQRRYLAHKLLGKDSIKATFTGDISTIDALLLSLSENMCRQEMNYEDISKAITALYRHFGDEYKVKEHTGFSIRMIRDYLQVEANATDKIKNLIAAGDLTMADAKRAISAAQGDQSKADTLVDEIAKLSKYEKKRLIETSRTSPNSSADELIEKAKQPKLEETVILNLPRKVHKALLEASVKLSVDVEELTINTLVSWLKTNDFLTEA
jgi:ParB/RepB/Spo0J family partition protein